MYIYIYIQYSASVQGFNGKLVLWKVAGNLTSLVKPMIEVAIEEVTDRHIKLLI